ncbi:WXG100 family type VII secretion target, partial [Frankia sp. CiP1_Cm_nod1]|uniref:WXG100 family type VII secretion target n=1 Tax=Frankia sp. CiP1_Cm_nod1 TaxID=2897160 RepID=UPI004044F2A3
MSRPTDWSVLGLERDPTPGDPFAVRELARRFLTVAADAEHARGQLATVAAGGVVQTWAGTAGDAFRDELDDFPGQLARLATSYRMAGQALGAYEPALDTAQQQADRALAHGRDARARRDHAQALLTPAQTALTTATATLTHLTPTPHTASAGIPPPDPTRLTQAIRDRDTAQIRLEQARDAAHGAQDDLDTARRLALAAGRLRADAAHTCGQAIRDASDAGIHTRRWWSGEKIRQAAGSLWHTTVQAAKITIAVLGVVALVIGG